MAKFLVVFAQALDNRSEDHISMDGQKLSPSAVLDREKASKLLSSVTSDGKKIFEFGGVELFFYSSKCVVEVIPEELDSAGRVAPIAVCFNFEEVSQASEIITYLIEFSNSIGRTINPIRLGLVNQALTEELKKKRSEGGLFPFLHKLFCKLIMFFVRKLKR